MEKKMTSKNIIIQPDVDGTGGMIFIHPGNREDVVMRNYKNTLKVSRVLAEVLLYHLLLLGYVRPRLLHLRVYLHHKSVL